MLVLSFVFLALVSWLVVGYQVFAWRRPYVTQPHAYHCVISIGQLWLSQALVFLALAYSHIGWLWAALARLLLAPLATALTCPTWARFTAVPYPTYPLSCCLLE